MAEQPWTAKNVMEHMSAYFQPEKAAGVDAVVQYVLTGENGGEWHMTVANGSCSVGEGSIANPKVTITMDAQDYVDLTTGKLDAIKAFMQGKVKLTGDFALATRLQSFFRAP